VEAAARKSEWLAVARQAMETEAQAIRAAGARLDENLLRAVELILGSEPSRAGKLVVTGIGKSGYVARKIVATFQSTGTPAVFLHPVEAAHGDLGLCQQRDPVLMISKSGATLELLQLVPALKEFQSSFIGILGNIGSPLAGEMDVVLDASVQREADPEGFTPTASTAVALALGHALALAVMQARGFTAEHFARFHGAGQLGRNLNVTVREAMHSGREVAWAASGDSLKQVVIAMSERPLGAACVISPDHHLVGLITEGDLRRALRAHDDIRALCAADVMTRSPVRVHPAARLHDALSLMEDRPMQISVLPVVDDAGVCLGLIRVHDIYRSGGARHADPSGPRLGNALLSDSLG
jgi:arabinose-5-phosphate isomerase